MVDNIQRGIQDIIYSLEEGRAARFLRTVLLFGFIVGIVGIYGYTQFRGLRDAAAMDYAQVGRELARGAGFRTSCIRPAQLGHLEKIGLAANLDGAQPDLVHAPVYPAALAVGFQIAKPSFTAERGRLFAPERLVVVPVGQLFTIATCLMVLALGRLLFNRTVALVSALAYVLSHAVLAESISGFPTPLSCFLSTSAFTAAVFAIRSLSSRRSPRTHWGFIVLTAICTVLGALTDYSLVLLVPLLCGMFYFAIDDPGSRSGVTLVFLLLCIVGLAPWAFRNLATGGGPLGLAHLAVLQDTRLFEGEQAWRSLTPAFEQPRIFKALELKLWSNTAILLDGELWRIGGVIFMAFFTVSFIYRFVRDEVHVLRWIILVGIVLFSAWVALHGMHQARLLMIFSPFVVLYGVAFFFRVLDILNITIAPLRVSLAVVVVGISALPLILTLLSSRPQIPYPPYYPPLVQQVTQLLEEDEVLCSDIPEATAWYGDRVSVLLPGTLEEFYKIHGFVHRISGLYLTSRTADRPFMRDLVTGRERDWLPILNRQIPEDFPLEHGIALPRGSSDQLFLTDRVRWQE